MITALGWLGSALIVASLAMHRRVPFRLLNLLSAIVLLAFNFAIGLWSMVALNGAVLVVNAWHLQNSSVARAGGHCQPRSQGLARRRRPKAGLPDRRGRTTKSRRTGG
jgi:hypothetical protein